MDADPEHLSRHQEADPAVDQIDQKQGNLNSYSKPIRCNKPPHILKSNPQCLEKAVRFLLLPHAPECGVVRRMVEGQPEHSQGE